MNRKQRRICLVTSNHVASNPRLVKEADALVSAGYDVSVVAVNVSPAVKSLDETIFAVCAWKTSLVDRGSNWQWKWRALIRRAARWLYQYTPLRTTRVATMAFSQLTAPLTHAAIKESADIYIAHNLPALPAAARAAQKYGALLGFDAEDFHSEELDPDLYPLEGKLCAAIEAAYLPQCHHLTAAAPLIAQAYRQRYGVEMTTLLNVFPLSEAPSMPMPARAGASVLYWFSQTIGPDRGLEAMLSVLAVMRTPAELHLRGTPLPGYRDTLAALAEKLGVGTRLRFLPPAPPAEMAMIAASCTLGLSLEQDHPQNRAICLTNKVFTYLLAGIPILLSRTPAHIELAQALGNAALLVAPTGPGEAAAQIDLLLGDAELLAKARAKAWQLGHERFNWDFEQKVFLARIDALFRDAKN